MYRTKRASQDFALRNSNYCTTIAELLAATFNQDLNLLERSSPDTLLPGAPSPLGHPRVRISAAVGFFLAAVLASNNALGTPGSEFSLAYGSSLESLSTRFRCLLSFFSSNMLPTWSRQLSDVVYVSAHALSPPPHCRWFRR